MSDLLTITEADFAASMWADTEDLRPLHLTCDRCHPRGTPGTAVCGYRFPAQTPPENPDGEHKCAKCVAVRRGPWPCGHR